MSKTFCFLRFRLNFGLVCVFFAPFLLRKFLPFHCCIGRYSLPNDLVHEYGTYNFLKSRKLQTFTHSWTARQEQLYSYKRLQWKEVSLFAKYEVATIGKKKNYKFWKKATHFGNSSQSWVENLVASKKVVVFGFS